MDSIENLMTKIKLVDLQTEIVRAQIHILKCKEIILKMDSSTIYYLDIDFGQIQSILESAKRRTEMIENLY